MSARPQHLVLLAGAGIVAAASAVVFGVLTWRNARGPGGPAPTVQLSDAAYASAVAEATPVRSETWTPPPAQPRGRDWVYDTFTPPEIFYNARSKQFTVRPPSGVGDEPEEAFGLDLISVRPEPFRLQLIGKVGGDGNWRGTFENMVSGEVFLASAGRPVPTLGLTIRSLDVAAQTITLPDSMSTHQRVATAVVHDDRAGRDIILTDRERRMTGTVTAFVSVTGQSATREVRVGDEFKVGDVSYRIDRIELSPPSIDATRESPTLAQPDRRTLTPHEPESADPSDQPIS